MLQLLKDNVFVKYFAPSLSHFTFLSFHSISESLVTKSAIESFLTNPKEFEKGFIGEFPRSAEVEGGQTAAFERACDGIEAFVS
jgi:hypothetical protein